MYGSAPAAGDEQYTGDNADKARTIQAPRGGYQSLPEEPSNDSQVAHVVRNEAEYEHMADSQEALAYGLNRGMTAITLRIASSSTSVKPEEEFPSIKADNNNMEIAIREALRERSQSA